MEDPTSFLNVEEKPHPAKYSPEILQELLYIADEYVPNEGHILDPFAGVGLIHKLRDMGDESLPDPKTFNTVAIEIEPEWAIQAQHLGETWCGDFFAYDPGEFRYDAVFTSPTYGNRMADHHEAKDDTKRITYRHKLDRLPTHGSSAVLQWGNEYKFFHIKAWKKVRRFLKPGGIFALNIKNHVRKGEIVPVTDWHRRTLRALKFEFSHEVQIHAPGMRFGENHQARVEHESILVFRKSHETGEGG